MDGNRRAWLDAALTFLDLNGLAIDERANGQLLEATLAVAEGRVSKGELPALFSEVASPNNAAGSTGS